VGVVERLPPPLSQVKPGTQRLGMAMAAAVQPKFLRLTAQVALVLVVLLLWSFKNEICIDFP
jgi:hypothetical protein